MASSKLTLGIDTEAVKSWLEKADMVPVVRCEECKWYDKHDKRCKVWNHGVLSIGFCYRGEEREDEKDLDACVSGGYDISNDKCRGE